MNRKQRIFVAEYLKDKNATQACIRAGYSAKDPDVYGPHLLTLPDIKFAIDEGIKAIEKKTGLDAEYVLSVFKTVIDRCLQVVPVMEFDHVEKELVQKRDEETGEGIYEFDAQAVIQAASWIGKHRKMFTEKVEVSLSEGFAERLKRAREKVKRG